jgi:glycerol-3-phosphate dehydrogenase
VLVIGGGATGAGVARDLAMRGFRTILVEKSDWADGTTGRFNGLLHSGSRYSLRDIHTARECIQENLILRKILPHCIEDTGGYVVATPADDPGFADHLLERCQQAGVPVEEVPVGLVLRQEPFVNPGIRRALRVPDATADSFAATRSNVESARQYGARAWSYHPVTELLVRNHRVVGAVCRDLLKDEPVTVYADLVINAAGVWASQVAALAGVGIPIVCSKGSMIAAHQRIVNTAITRLRWPSECDSVLPCHSVSILGCTDVVVPDPDHFGVDAAEIRRIMQECSQLVPAVNDLRKLRVWAGVRPLVQAAAVERSASGCGTEAATGRGLSRGHVVLDHEVRDGLAGLLSIVGGKWTTYRLMAEQATDEACRLLGTVRPCRTHLEPLPGAKSGHFLRSIPLAEVERGATQGQLACECEMVTLSHIARALTEERTVTLDDLRRITRLGMGTCQGGTCSYRAAGLLHSLERRKSAAVPHAVRRVNTNVMLCDFLQERWKGIVPVAGGDQVRQMRFNEFVYHDVLRVDRPLRPVHSGEPQ